MKRRFDHGPTSGWNYLWLALISSALGCIPSPGPFMMPAVDGRVVDASRNEPVVGAEVIEWWRGAGAGVGSQPVYHARWTTTDADGRFRFSEATTPSVRMWLLRTYGPTYSLYHARYGHQHAAPRETPIVLLAFPDRAEQALRDLAPICRGERDDDGSRHLRALACAAHPASRGREAESNAIPES